MTALVSAERAARTWLTGATGLLIVAAAVVMMVLAAPAHQHARPHRPAVPHSATVSQLESKVWPGAPAASSPTSHEARTPIVGRP
jgi:hypothetical protein